MNLTTGSGVKSRFSFRFSFAFGLPKEKENLKLNLDFTPVEEKIYSLLIEPIEKDELVRKSGLPPAKANATVSMMILNGLIKESGGEIFRA